MIDVWPMANHSAENLVTRSPFTRLLQTLLYVICVTATKTMIRSIYRKIQVALFLSRNVKECEGRKGTGLQKNLYLGK